MKNITKFVIKILNWLIIKKKYLIHLLFFWFVLRLRFCLINGKILKFLLWSVIKKVLLWFG